MAKEAQLEQQRAAGRKGARDSARDSARASERGSDGGDGGGDGGGEMGGEVDGGGAEEAEDGDEVDAVEAFAELPALLEEPSILELPESRRALLAAQDTLTAQPAEGDEILFALPVCAPYSVLSSYRFRMKLTPGNQKKGKAARQAIGMLSAAAAGRERDLMRAVTDDELVRVMLGNVKIAAGGKQLQAQKTAEKRERKIAATANRQKQAGKEGGKELEGGEADE